MSKNSFKVFALAIAAATLAFLFTGCASEKTPSSTDEIPQAETTPDVDVTATLPPPTPSPEPTATPEPTPAPVTQLPALDTVTVESNPLLYDFMNGCVDWHVHVFDREYDGGLRVMWHDSSPNIVYVDNYIVQAGFTTPPMGQKIERHELSSRDAKVFHDVVNKSADNLSFKEGEWNLFVVAGSEVRRLYDENIELWSAMDYTTGNPRPFLEDGSGWPTEWLRREPYVTYLRENQGVDMNDPFWDMFQLYGVYKMVPGEHATPVGSPTITCTGFEMFRFENEGYVQENVSWDEIRDDCNHIGYNIPGIYKAWDWEPI